MRARKYNKKVELWQTTKADDGFGGQYNTDSLITNTWANIKTLDRANRSTDEGITDAFSSLVLTLRKRNDISYNLPNMYFKYRGLKYIIQQQPINKNYEDNEIEIIVTRQSVKDVNVFPTLSVFDNTFDNTFI